MALPLINESIVFQKIQLPSGKSVSIRGWKVKEEKELLFAAEKIEDNDIEKAKVVELLVTQALERVPAESAGPGEIIAVAGIENITIGETLADAENPVPELTGDFSLNAANVLTAGTYLDFGLKRIAPAQAPEAVEA